MYASLTPHQRLTGPIRLNKPGHFTEARLKAYENNPLVELAHKAQAQLVPTDYYGWAKLAVDPQLQPLGLQPKNLRNFVDRVREQVEGGSLGAAVDDAATTEEPSDSGRAQLGF